VDEAGKGRLRAALEAHGLSLTHVADACGVSRSAVSNWFLSGPGWRPIPDRHMATIRELLEAPNASMAAGPHETRVSWGAPSPPAKAVRSRSEPQHAMGASAALQLPALPTKRRRRAPPRSPPPQPMHWGAPPFLGLKPPPSSPMHYPGHWASPPVMPPAPTYVSPAAGPQHAAIVAAHNRASQLGERRDVRSPPGGGEFP
jgi:transcriptional regulator with XRE-family HTH domain